MMRYEWIEDNPARETPAPEYRLFALAAAKPELFLKKDNINRLPLLLAQAKLMSELCKQNTHRATAGALTKRAADLENIVLIGMPGAGKSSIAKSVARLTGRPCFDTDIMIQELAGMSIPEIFAEHGEPHFRALESEAIAEASKGSGRVIASGGGAVLAPQNQYHLRQTGRIYWLKRSLEKLPTHGRPLSRNLEMMYETRKPIYAALADYVIENEYSINSAAQRIVALHSLGDDEE